MMAADSGSPPPARLPAATLAAVRESLLVYLGNGQLDPLRGALQQLAAEARAQALQPEQLLIALKELWHSLPPVRRTSSIGEQGELLERVVSLSIRAYFGDE